MPIAARLPPTVLMDRGFGHSRFRHRDRRQHRSRAPRLPPPHRPRPSRHRLRRHLLGARQYARAHRRLPRRAEPRPARRPRTHPRRRFRYRRLPRPSSNRSCCAPSRPTAIFAANYVATLGAVKAIRALDLDFPGEVSLLGFDDTDWMTVLRPYLSVVAQPVAGNWRMPSGGCCASGWATRRAPCRHLRLPCTLAVRESTQRPRVAQDRDTNPDRSLVIRKLTQRGSPNEKQSTDHRLGACARPWPRRRSAGRRRARLRRAAEDASPIPSGGPWPRASPRAARNPASPSSSRPRSPTRMPRPSSTSATRCWSASPKALIAAAINSSNLLPCM